MYHVRFRGTHYEIGYRFGASLKKHGRRLLDNVPFPVTQERIDFAHSCLPAYQEFFPEIIEEIRGLAEGQSYEPAEQELLQAVLFSMYAIPPACNCSCFAVSNKDHVLLGRNSDFLTSLEKLNTNVIYRFINDSYSFTGNTTAFIEIEDGVNIHGLAVGLTSVYPVTIKPGLNGGMLLRFFLEKCKSTEEVIRHIQYLPISSAQAITVADSKGDFVVMECNSQKIKIIRPSEEQPFVCATNRFYSEEMAIFQNPDVDDWQSKFRYRTLVQTLSQYYDKMDIQTAQDLLAGKHGFLCQYNRATGKDTVWSVLYDLKQKAIYRVEGNPGRKKFVKDERFSICSANLA